MRDSPSKRSSSLPRGFRQDIASSTEVKAGFSAGAKSGSSHYRSRRRTEVTSPLIWAARGALCSPRAAQQVLIAAPRAASLFTAAQRARALLTSAGFLFSPLFRKTPPASDRDWLMQSVQKDTQPIGAQEGGGLSENGWNKKNV
ncbi:hypothetical protein MHYP_G00149290 [Metynnis hypsauchen]